MRDLGQPEFAISWRPDSVIFSSGAILDALHALDGRGSKRRIRAALREKGYDIPTDEFEFHFDQLLRNGRIRPMIGEASKLEDAY